MLTAGQIPLPRFRHAITNLLKRRAALFNLFENPVGILRPHAGQPPVFKFVVGTFGHWFVLHVG